MVYSIEWNKLHCTLLLFARELHLQKRCNRNFFLKEKKKKKRNEKRKINLHDLIIYCNSFLYQFFNVCFKLNTKIYWYIYIFSLKINLLHFSCTRATACELFPIPNPHERSAFPNAFLPGALSGDTARPRVTHREQDADVPASECGSMLSD